MAPTTPRVELWPIDSAQRLNLLADWLCTETCHWIDFGSQRISPAWLRMWLRRRDHELRLFGRAASGHAVGVVGLSNISTESNTGMVWGFLGEKEWTRQGLTTAAMSEMLTIAFRDRACQAVNTWAFDQSPTMAMILRLHFRFVGCERAFRAADREPQERLWFDLLATEHMPDAAAPFPARALRVVG